MANLDKERIADDKTKSRKYKFVRVVVGAGLILTAGLFAVGEYTCATTVFTTVALLVAGYCGLNVLQKRVFAAGNGSEYDDEGAGSYRGV